MLGRITFRNYDFDGSIDRAPIEEDAGPFEELVDEYYRMQEGFGPYVTRLWDDENNIVYDIEDAEYDRFSTCAKDLMNS